MDPKIERTITVEWMAQELLHRFQTSGPLIKVILDVIPDLLRPDEINKPSQYLIIQGSFDPPTTSHIDIILKAIDLHSKLNPSDSIRVLLLLSLSHVDKKVDVLNRSLFGYRIDMLEKLFSSLKLEVPISIGLSNVARYIDLIDAARQISFNINKISFIIGMDVFKKLLDPSYYSNSLEQVLPLIFRADYYIAGRADVFSKKEFDSFLNSQLNDKFYKHIHFLSLKKTHRYLNASLIRDRYSKKESIQDTHLHSTISKYLEKNNIYQLTPNWIATKIAIQLVVHLTLTTEKDQIIAIEILKRLLPEIEGDSQLQQTLISEYQAGKANEISKRWNQLFSLIS
ncbi:MAG: hypothetical protein ACFFC6_02675 [Promethearchaeota archaeon]